MAFEVSNAPSWADSLMQLKLSSFSPLPPKTRPLPPCPSDQYLGSPSPPRGRGVMFYPMTEPYALYEATATWRPRDGDESSIPSSASTYHEIRWGRS